ncbi:MAG: DUF3013 family protein [Lactobacillus sp.]|jgi:hypothetical protein|nr:DUF3013 family protein [Lactobacillus sp.]MCI2032659.1 DUF3013 family protein [Lactobacillus sp.]
MTDTNMLDYIGDKMDALDFDGDLDLNWDKQAHVIELEMTMYVDAAEGFEVEDQDGQQVEAGNEVDYADAILFYDRTRLNGADYQENYLATFGFAGKKGIEKAQVDALFGYLQDLLDDGQSDLFDFVDGTSEAETFELMFDQAKYDAAYAAQPNAAKQTFLAYPKF